MNAYREQVYSSLLGMIIGTIAGTPQEIGPWNMDNIQSLFGDNDEFYLPTTRYAADDDINGPLFFSKALYYQQGQEFETNDLKTLWLNMIRYKKGMFWWGPSTERMAYENILKGMPAEECGSKLNNGENMANQIGGQIFSDCWGMLFAGSPYLASEYAAKSARLSHDENGVEGAKFIASLIAVSYNSKQEMRDDIYLAAEFLEPDSQYFKVVSMCLSKYDSRLNFQSQTKQMIEQLGYEEGPNFGHIIPNAIICVNALLASNGDFESAIKYATSFGYDTDCNGSTIGSIVGMRTSVKDIPKKYLKMINDTVVSSSAIGSMNTNTISEITNEFVAIKSSIENNLKPEFYSNTGFDFSLPYATQGLFSNNSANVFVIPKEQEHLTVNITMLTPHEEVYLSKKSMFLANQLQDLRYSPVFAPTIYPNQIITFEFDTNKAVTTNVEAALFVKTLQGENIQCGEFINLLEASKIEAKLDKLDNKSIIEYGLKFRTINNELEFSFGSLNIKAIKISGKPQYVIDFNNQIIDCESVSPFSHDGGLHNLKQVEKQYKMTNQMLEYSSLSGATSITGMITHEISCVEYQLIPLYGESHNMIFNGSGLRENISFGFTSINKVSVIINKTNQSIVECELDFDWELEQSYTFKVEYKNDKLNYYIDNKLVYESNQEIKYGLHGYKSAANCAGYIKKITINNM